MFDQDLRLSLVSTFLRKCPLCGRINTYSSDSCVDCGWSGAFQMDGEVVREALLRIYADSPATDESTIFHWFNRAIES